MNELTHVLSDLKEAWLNQPLVYKLEHANLFSLPEKDREYDYAKN